MNQNSFDTMLELIDELEEKRKWFEEVKEQLLHLKNNTDLGKFVNFPYRNDSNYLSGIFKDLDRIIDIKDTVLKAKNISDKDIEFEIGDLLTSTEEIRLASDGFKRYLETDGSHYYGFNESFLIFDIIGSDYVLKSTINFNGPLFYVNNSLIKMYFEKKDKTYNYPISKLEFIISGIDAQYVSYLNEAKFFEKTARERTGNNWNFGENYNDASKTMSAYYDEAFGLMVNVYISDGTVKDYKEIIFVFGEKFAVGYTKSDKKDEEDIYRYNAKISYFTKDSGKDGAHYFPKDVFNDTPKNRFISLIDKAQVLSPKSENVL